MHRVLELKSEKVGSTNWANLSIFFVLKEPEE